MTGAILLLTVIFLPILSAVAAYAIGRKNESARDVFAICAVSANFLLCLLLAFRFQGTELRLPDMGVLALHFRIDGFRALYGSVTAFLWLVTTLFSPEYFAHSHKKNRYWLFNLLTFGATMGVFFSADLRTTFLFFEIMSFTSYALVAHEENEKALAAARTFLAVAVIGGLAVLMGMLMLNARFGTLEFARLREISTALSDRSPLYLPGALMLAGFGGKAGMYPLHIWLPKAHPVAPAPASALLSGILTKTGVFGVVVISTSLFASDYRWGVALLIPAGITMLLGAVLGVFSNDLKRTLACSSVSQIGFILVGIAMLVLLGDENALAARGTVLHMLNHSLFKLVLFVSAGIVYLNRHELSLGKIRGFGRGKPLFMFAFLMAALGISGFPFWSGHISKILLNYSIYAGIYMYSGLPLEGPLRFLDAAFKFTGFLTAAYMTKLFVALFLERGSCDAHYSAHGKEPYIKSRLFAFAFALSAALIPILGLFPHIAEAVAANAQAFFHSDHVPSYPPSYFSLSAISEKVLFFLIGVGIYIFIVRFIMMRRKEAGMRLYTDYWPAALDLETLVYRPFLRSLVSASGFAAAAAAHAVDAVVAALKPLISAAGFAAGLASFAVDMLAALKPLAKFDKFAAKTAPVLDEKQRASGESLREFWARYTAFGIFSTNMLFVGIGICLAIVFVFTRAFLP